jgi:hypothetical protein
VLSTIRHPMSTTKCFDEMHVRSVYFRRAAHDNQASTNINRFQLAELVRCPRRKQPHTIHEDTIDLFPLWASSVVFGFLFIAAIGCCLDRIQRNTEPTQNLNVNLDST